MVRQGRCVLVAGLLGLSMSAWGQQVTIPEEYDKLIRHRGEITAFGNEGFGDRIDIGSGGLEIIQTDVDLPGNNALPVRVSRRFVAGNRYGGGLFGIWSLDIPHAYGIFGDHAYNPVGWTVQGDGADIYKRCSNYSPPLVLLFQTGVFEPDEYWHGNFFHLPGADDEELLSADVNAHVPADGNSYPVVTKSGAAARCVALASTSEAGSQGEGFEIVTPDGVVYTLNQMVSRSVELISKPLGQMALRETPPANPSPQPMEALKFNLSRKEVLLYPTKVADRFGNYVSYVWSAANPGQLLRIVASDGRQITFTYGSGGVSVNDGTSTWTYVGSAGAFTVTRPDGSTWVSNLDSLFNFKLQPTGDGCTGEPAYNFPSVITGTITSPTGAVATYSMTPVKFGRSWVGRECVIDDSFNPVYAVEPIAYFNFSVVEKKILGPGLPAGGLSWSYSYGPANGCWSNSDYLGCTAASPTTRVVSVTAPDGAVTRHTFGNVLMGNEGFLLRTEYGLTGSSALRVVEYVYADKFASPYWAYNGDSLRRRGDVLTAAEQRPKRKVVTTQQGRRFTWEVASDCSGMPYCFDTHARPTKVVKSSAASP